MYGAHPGVDGNPAVGFVGIVVFLLAVRWFRKDDAPKGRRRASDFDRKVLHSLDDFPPAPREATAPKPPDPPTTAGRVGPPGARKTYDLWRRRKG